ncbi:MAG: ABC transporter substrate-binding protein [Candidatus Thorarchaeota archaeon]
MTSSCQKIRKALLPIIFLLISSSSIVPSLQTMPAIPNTLKSGPFLDRIVFATFESEEEQVQALLANEVDIIGMMIDPAFAPTLSESECVEIATTLRNGYGYLLINYLKYPFNLTAFRRALAFAIDKQSICYDLWDGLAEPLDSLVPKINPFSIEGQLPYSYYEADVQSGNNLLDAAGFVLNSTTGYRDAPNGEPFHVFIDVPYSSLLGMDIGAKTVEALESLKISATSTTIESNQYLLRCSGQKDFDIIFLGNVYNDLDVDWLAYPYQSENEYAPFYTLPNFMNSTYDSWSDQLLHSPDYDKVYEAAVELQKIRVYQCPEIILYENMFVSAYRTDRFEGIVNDVLDGIPSWWTNYKTHLKDEEGGPYGGTLRWAFPLDVDSFNFMVSSNCPGNRILDSLLYDSLLRRDPTGHNLPWLAESYTFATNDDDPTVTPGNTRLTFNILRNASWTDGVPLTAEDVAFTINYYRDAPENMFEPDLQDLKMAIAPTHSKVVLEFEGESYWHLSKIAYKPIIPKHVFAEIGLDSWDMWNPQPPNEEMVTSGPFNVSEYMPSEFTEVTYNPDYFYTASHCGNNSGPSDPQPPDTRLFFISGIITGGSIGVIIVVIVLWRETS